MRVIWKSPDSGRFDDLTRSGARWQILSVGMSIEEFAKALPTETLPFDGARETALVTATNDIQWWARRGRVRLG